MRTAIYSGSFDIVTEGHLWMIKKGLSLFDQLIVGIGTNPAKQTLFDFNARKQLLESICQDLSGNLVIEDFGNLALVQFAHDKNAKYILRGIRSISDFDYERMLKNVNTDLDESIETVFLMPPRHLAEVSSSMVKGMLKIKDWENIVKRYVPDVMRSALIERYSCNPVEVACYLVGASASATLAKNYSEAGRFYHTLNHLENCLIEFREVEAQLKDSQSVLLALLFHDLIYDAKAQSPLANETASWNALKQLCQLNDQDHATIMNHILHTSHSYTGFRDADTDYVCDIDMAILGYPNAVLMEYEADIRHEYAHASDSQYRDGRCHFLQSVLNKESIFKTSHFNKKYESTARNNIKKLIEHIRSQT